MKVILEFTLNFLLWFFYYQTTINYSEEIDYHTFVVNSFLFCLPFIFNCISIFCEKEKVLKSMMFYILVILYLFITLSFISCLSLEFILSNRTFEDLCFGIPGFFQIKLTIKKYATYLLFFPVFNTSIHDWLDVILNINSFFIMIKEEKNKH